MVIVIREEKKRRKVYKESTKIKATKEFLSNIMTDNNKQDPWTTSIRRTFLNIIQ